MTPTQAPPSILTRRAELTRWLDHGDGLLLGLDFDGTLAPIVSDPDDALIDGRAKRLVGDLSTHPAVTVAIISGRSLDDLRPRVGIDGPLYAGNHGLELADVHSRRTHPVADARQPTIERLTRELRERLSEVPGAFVEYKDLTATIHFREASNVGRVTSTVESVVSASDADVEVTEGRAVREIRPELEWGKDAAMQLFRSLAPEGHRSMYIGDDLTDEEAFEVVEDDGIGVRVGAETGPGTAANYQVPNQQQVPELLDWLVEYAEHRWPRDDAEAERERALAQWDETWHPSTLEVASDGQVS